MTAQKLRVRLVVVFLLGLAVGLVAAKVLGTLDQLEWPKATKFWDIACELWAELRPNLLAILLRGLLWLMLWLVLTMVFAAATAFGCFLMERGQDREGLCSMGLLLIGECVLAGVLAVPAAGFLLRLWH